MPVLSVIVPIYKVEKYLEQCIESILQQSYKNFELILVDDGSPDNCPTICEQYAKKDNRIRVVHKQNGGLVSARKAGLQIAKGTYVAYVDGDDWIDSDMYERCILIMEKENADVMVCGYCAEIEDGTSTCMHSFLRTGVYRGEKLEELYRKALYSGKFYEPGIVAAVWNKVYRKDILLENQFNVSDNIRMGEDAACTYPTLLDANCIVIENEICPYHYRILLSSMSRSYDPLYFQRIFEHYGNLKQTFLQKNQDMCKQLSYYMAFLLLLGMHQELNWLRKNGIRNTIKKLKGILKEYHVSDLIDFSEIQGIPKKEKKELSYIKNGKIILFIASHYMDGILAKIK